MENNFIDYKLQIKAKLSNLFAVCSKKNHLTVFDPNLFSHLSSLATAGKMLRGSLLVNIHQALVDDNQAQNKIEPKVLKAAAALELFQTALLIHDDIIDQDELRRGQPTFHSRYEKQLPTQGNNLALCVGDIAFFLGYELLPSSLNQLFSQHLTTTALGEMQDVRLAQAPIDEVSKKEILTMYQNKTASYSLVLPLQAGAKLVGIELPELKEIGQLLGLIFQLKDDELGLFGHQKKTGKPIGADIREGKKTLHYLFLQQAASKKDKKLMEQVFGQSEASLAQIDQILSLFTKYEIKKKVDEELKTFKNKVKEKIETLNQETLKTLLLDFLKLNLTRSK